VSLQERVRLELSLPAGKFRAVSVVRVPRNGDYVDALLDNNFFMRAARGQRGFPDAIRQLRSLGFHLNPIAGLCEQVISNRASANDLIHGFRRLYGHQAEFEDLRLGGKERLNLQLNEHPNYALEVRVLRNSILHFAMILKRKLGTEEIAIELLHFASNQYRRRPYLLVLFSICVALVNSSGTGDLRLQRDCVVKYFNLPDNRSDDVLDKWAHNRACDIALQRWAYESYSVGTYLNQKPAGDVLIVSADIFVTDVLFRYLVLAADGSLAFDDDEYARLPSEVDDMLKFMQNRQANFSPRVTETTATWKHVDAVWSELLNLAQSI
jgi:hypothetical protein